MAYAGKTDAANRFRAGPRLAQRTPFTEPRAAPRPIGALATGLAIGLIVGAGVALLFAPQRGQETRYEIGRGFRRLRHRGHDAWGDLRDELHRVRRRFRRDRRRARADADLEPV